MSLLPRLALTIFLFGCGRSDNDGDVHILFWEPACLNRLYDPDVTMESVDLPSGSHYQILRYKHFDGNAVFAEGRVAQTGARTGLWQFNYQSGTRSAMAFYENNVVNGTLIAWYQTGELKSVARYTLGSRNGVAYSWHKNGKLHSVVNYRNNKPDGEVQVWCSDGSVDGRASGTYLSGVRVE